MELTFVYSGTLKDSSGRYRVAVCPYPNNGQIYDGYDGINKDGSIVEYTTSEKLDITVKGYIFIDIKVNKMIDYIKSNLVVIGICIIAVVIIVYLLINKLLNKNLVNYKNESLVYANSNTNYNDIELINEYNYNVVKQIYHETDFLGVFEKGEISRYRFFLVNIMN